MLNWYNPHGVMNAVFHQSSGSIGIMLYADRRSSLENTIAPLALSNRASMLGNGYASLTVISFNAQ